MTTCLLLFTRDSACIPSLWTKV